MSSLTASRPKSSLSHGWRLEERVALDFNVEIVDQYGRLLSYLWLPDD